ncbi:MAG TPA: alpha/beta fold hydrolase [Anaerolineales bacterium]|nr:alpha/beta fold hydrolase [Anaerolineales bacterium]
MTKEKSANRSSACVPKITRAEDTYRKVVALTRVECGNNRKRLITGVVMRVFGLCWLGIALALCTLACQQSTQLVSLLATATPTVTATFTPSSTASSTPSPTATVTPSLTPTATLTPTPAPTATPDVYANYTIAHLQGRTYGAGELQIEETWGNNGVFTRYLVSYPSDGLNLYAFMNVPAGEGPFPVVLVLHGYVNPDAYQVLTYTTRYADALARAGFLVIHPNYRNHPPSTTGADNYFRTGYAVDVLNLIALVKKQGGQAGALQLADPNRIGQWGHSMGGGIAQKVAVVSPDVRATVLYGAMSSDDYLNFQRIYYVFGGNARVEGLFELAATPADYERISPLYYLQNIQGAVSIHHGLLDEEVPPEWSAQTCQQLQALGKSAECFQYPMAHHIFYDADDALFLQRVIAFFQSAFLTD